MERENEKNKERNLNPITTFFPHSCSTEARKTFLRLTTECFSLIMARTCFDSMVSFSSSLSVG